MRVHHLNCATMCPPGGRLMDPALPIFSRGRLVCHCLLIETARGLVLVDTGLGLDDLSYPRERLGRSFVSIVKPRLDPEETARRQVERLGFKASDVRHIVLTHLDVDHAGALGDFPDARVHVYAPEYDAATRRATFLERERYRPMQWAHGPLWQQYEAGGEAWFGFKCVRALAGLTPEILIVPMVGHSRGHCAVAVDVGTSWLLHAGDAYFFRDEMDATSPRCPPALSFFQSLVQTDAKARRSNQVRLRDLAREHGDKVKIFSAHDPVEFATLARPHAADAHAA